MGRLLGRCHVLKRHFHLRPLVIVPVSHEIAVCYDILALRVEEGALVGSVELHRGFLRATVFVVVPVTESHPDASSVAVSDLHRVIVRLVPECLVGDDSCPVPDPGREFLRPVCERPSHADDTAAGSNGLVVFSGEYVSCREFDDHVV